MSISDEIKNKSQLIVTVILAVGSLMTLLTNFSLLGLLSNIIGLLICYASMGPTMKYTEKILTKGEEKVGGKVGYYILLGIGYFVASALVGVIMMLLFMATSAAAFATIGGMSIGGVVIICGLLILVCIVAELAINFCMIIPYIRALVILYLQYKENADSTDSDIKTTSNAEASVNTENTTVNNDQETV